MRLAARSTWSIVWSSQTMSPSRNASVSGADAQALDQHGAGDAGQNDDRFHGHTPFPRQDHYWRESRRLQGGVGAGEIPGARRRTERIRGQAPGARHGPSAANVLQLRMSPDSSPALNQRCRCSAEPCVNDSGTT